MDPAKSGRGYLALTATLFVISFAASAAWKFVPVKIAHGALRDCIGEELKFAGRPGNSEKKIQESVYDCARSLGLSDVIEKGQIRVTLESSRVRIVVDYERKLVMPGWTYVWPFHVDETRPLF
ncbi:MAG: hypothetical protein U0166_10025 [Acidobacteriota bacterium]